FCAPIIRAEGSRSLDSPSPEAQLRLEILHQSLAYTGELVQQRKDLVKGSLQCQTLVLDLLLGLLHRLAAVTGELRGTSAAVMSGRVGQVADARPMEEAGGEEEGEDGEKVETVGGSSPSRDEEEASLASDEEGSSSGEEIIIDASGDESEGAISSYSSSLGSRTGGAVPPGAGALDGDHQALDKAREPRPRDKAGVRAGGAVAGATSLKRKKRARADNPRSRTARDGTGNSFGGGGRGEEGPGESRPSPRWWVVVGKTEEESNPPRPTCPVSDREFNEMIQSCVRNERLEKLKANRAATLKRLQVLTGGKERADVLGRVEPKGHWSHLLMEMSWMSEDFKRERKQHTSQSKKTARSALHHYEGRGAREAKRIKEEQLALRRTASRVAREVRGFWAKLNKVISYKQKLEADEVRRKAMDKHLVFLVKQTERYSSLLCDSGRSVEQALMGEEEEGTEE
ncbi:unnamed protein product, partial [Discosporangium mesarthrocarpum]